MSADTTSTAVAAVACLPGCEHPAEALPDNVVAYGGHGCVVHLGDITARDHNGLEPLIPVQVKLTRFTFDTGEVEDPRVELCVGGTLNPFVGSLPLDALPALARLFEKAAMIADGGGLVLRAETDSTIMHGGGTRTYRAYLDGEWVGWVGDGRRFTGTRYGGRKWWACWRQDGDTAARWSSGLAYPTREAAKTALAAEVREGRAVGDPR